MRADNGTILFERDAIFDINLEPNVYPLDLSITRLSGTARLMFESNQGIQTKFATMARDCKIGLTAGSYIDPSVINSSTFYRYDDFDRDFPAPAEKQIQYVQAIDSDLQTGTFQNVSTHTDI